MGERCTDRRSAGGSRLRPHARARALRESRIRTLVQGPAVPDAGRPAPPLRPDRDRRPPGRASGGVPASQPVRPGPGARGRWGTPGAVERHPPAPRTVDRELRPSAGLDLGAAGHLALLGGEPLRFLRGQPALLHPLRARRARRPGLPPGPGGDGPGDPGPGALGPPLHRREHAVDRRSLDLRLRLPRRGVRPGPGRLAPRRGVAGPDPRPAPLPAAVRADEGLTERLAPRPEHGAALRPGTRWDLVTYLRRGDGKSKSGRQLTRPLLRSGAAQPSFPTQCFFRRSSVFWMRASISSRARWITGPPS